MPLDKPIYKPLGQANPINWVKDAACEGVDIEVFYPEPDKIESGKRGKGAWQQRNYEKAIRICQGCPVREPCLDYALITEEAYGVWGGMSPEQRKAYRKDLASIRDGLINSRLTAQRVST